MDTRMPPLCWFSMLDWAWPFLPDLIRFFESARLFVFYDNLSLLLRSQVDNNLILFGHLIKFAQIFCEFLYIVRDVKYFLFRNFFLHKFLKGCGLHIECKSKSLLTRSTCQNELIKILLCRVYMVFLYTSIVLYACVVEHQYNVYSLAWSCKTCCIFTKSYRLPYMSEGIKWCKLWLIITFCILWEHWFPNIYVFIVPVIQVEANINYSYN